MTNDWPGRCHECKRAVARLAGHIEFTRGRALLFCRDHADSLALDARGAIIRRPSGAYAIELDGALWLDAAGIPEVRSTWEEAAAAVRGELRRREQAGREHAE